MSKSFEDGEFNEIMQPLEKRYNLKKLKFWVPLTRKDLKYLCSNFSSIEYLKFKAPSQEESKGKKEITKFLLNMSNLKTLRIMNMNPNM